MTAPVSSEAPPTSTPSPASTEQGDVNPTPCRPLRAPKPVRRKGLYSRMEAFISRLAARNNFWHSITSLLYLPFAFRSGIRMHRLSKEEFTDNQQHGKKHVFEAILPFKKFNKNWYNAMAGAALLGNAEIAGGMYVFGIAGSDYTVVCKKLEYTFLRPCFGPAVYRIISMCDIASLVAEGGEFNAPIRMNVVEQIRIPGAKEKRVGRVEVTFHVTPKSHHEDKAKRKAEAASGKTE